MKCPKLKKFQQLIEYLFIKTSKKTLLIKNYHTTKQSNPLKVNSIKVSNLLTKKDFQ